MSINKIIMKRSLLFVLGFVVIGVATAFVIIKEDEFVKKKELTEESEITEITEGYDIGDIATDFSLKGVDDELVSLSDYPDAKGFIVIFTCNHCPFAIAYEDRIIDLDAMYKNKGYPVIAINPNNPDVMESDSFDAMKVRAEEKGFTFPYLFDDGQKIFPQYGATKTPHIYILQKENDENVVKYIGAIDNNYSDAELVTEKYVEDAINSLISGEEVEVKTTKAIGCSIKS